jgi:hypothetical protein
VAAWHNSAESKYRRITLKVSINNPSIFSKAKCSVALRIRSLCQFKIGVKSFFEVLPKKACGFFSMNANSGHLWEVGALRLSSFRETSAHVLGKLTNLTQLTIHSVTREMFPNIEMLTNLKMLNLLAPNNASHSTELLQIVKVPALEAFFFANANLDVNRSIEYDRIRHLPLKRILVHWPVGTNSWKSLRDQNARTNSHFQRRCLRQFNSGIGNPSQVKLVDDSRGTAPDWHDVDAFD